MCERPTAREAFIRCFCFGFFINIPRGSLLVVTTNLKLMANSMNWTFSCLLSAKFEVFHSALLCFRLFSFAFFQYFESVAV